MGRAPRGTCVCVIYLIDLLPGLFPAVCSALSASFFIFISYFFYWLPVPCNNYVLFLFYFSALDIGWLFYTITPAGLDG
ncbi:hypothetical protein ASPWEDRAFT_375028 [Aspergillus wentii DTO 134E9]|uniref:Uncharacterized protein n=1 Tax=Aspergillus wentii DTO 134E9 TaxID=1073089 RepID=A0A1L9RX54_ASPWE|nr:uncharacterized protein ASPWEDRAFT_375028 [Aspergillus wentii DTO 134E9]OJJ39454.1 hypothetical protein ASPWEDRAFT_375028 [Aspergillus wentii DTO 134E9]